MLDHYRVICFPLLLTEQHFAASADPVECNAQRPVTRNFHEGKPTVWGVPPATASLLKLPIDYLSSELKAGRG